MTPTAAAKTKHLLPAWCGGRCRGPDIAPRNSNVCDGELPGPFDVRLMASAEGHYHRRCVATNLPAWLKNRTVVVRWIPLRRPRL